MILVSFGLCLAARLAQADMSEPVVRLTIHPMAATQQSLQYKFLPELSEQTPGNAANMYLIAAKFGPEAKQAYELEDRAINYLALPAEQMPRDQVAQILEPFSTRLRLADLAAHRQEVQWDYSLREEGVHALLPQLNDMRGFAILWSLQARLKILAGDWPAAVRTIGDGLSLARQLNRQGVIPQSLVGVGIADETLSTGVRDWISHRDAPNLYWSLSSLPEPFFDVHEMAEWERSIAYFTFPLLRDVTDRGDDPDRWRAFMTRLPELTENAKPSDLTNQFKAAALAALAYAHAQTYLLADGRTQAQIDAMSVDKAVGTYFIEQYRQLSDEAWKAWELPFWEGQGELKKWTSKIESERQELGANPLLVLIPHLERVRYQFAVIDREIAMLRIVEAVRDYAARHGGNPPVALDEIKDLPVPIDPLRNQPFRYEQHGQTVTIESPSYDEFPVHGIRYELTVAR